MKLTSLFKKAATVLCALALVGMLAACSNGSSSSDNDKDKDKGSGSGFVEKGEYKIMYDGILLADGGTEDALDMFTEGTDYTISGKTVTLKDSGFEKALKMMRRHDKKVNEQAVL